MTDEELNKLSIEELKKIVITGTNLLPHVPQSEAKRAKRILDYKLAELALQNNSTNNTTNFYAPITVHAQNSIIGNDGKIAPSVTIGELVNALAEGIDKNLPESQEKQGTLATLKSILKSDTFTTMLGKSVGEFFKTITHQR